MTSMDTGIEGIVSKAKVLSEMIRNHEVSLRYTRCVDLMKADARARELHSRLVSLGSEINARIAGDGGVDTQAMSEFELIRQGLEETPLVKEFITSRREYLEMIRQVLEKIRGTD